MRRKEEERKFVQIYIYKLKRIKETKKTLCKTMANQYTTEQLFLRVEQRRLLLRQQETQARWQRLGENVDLEPRRISFLPDMLDNYGALGTRVRDMHDEIRADREELQSSLSP